MLQTFHMKMGSGCNFILMQIKVTFIMVLHLKLENVLLHIITVLRTHTKQHHVGD